MKNKLLKYITRKSKPIVFNDLTRMEPISDQFGFDRGTPIDRYYIEEFLSKNAKLIQGDVLEIEENNYTKLFGGTKVAKSQILSINENNSSSVIVADLTNIATLPKSIADCFVCTQTFNFIYDIQKAVDGVHHLLKSDGVLLATVAGLCQISRYDMDRWGDYWRFTTASLAKLFEEKFGNNIRVESYGNIVSATALLQGLAIEDLPDKKVLDFVDPNYQVIITIMAKKY